MQLSHTPARGKIQNIIVYLLRLLSPPVLIRLCLEVGVRSIFTFQLY